MQFFSYILILNDTPFLIPHFLFSEKKKAAASKHNETNDSPRYHSNCAKKAPLYGSKKPCADNAAPACKAYLKAHPACSEAIRHRTFAAAFHQPRLSESISPSPSSSLPFYFFIYFIIISPICQYRIKSFLWEALTTTIESQNS